MITLIVGAGPVGLTLAIELARRGVACRIIDKAPRRSDTSKALVLWTRTLELLEPMGCLATVLERGHAIYNTTIYDENHRRLLSVDLSQLDSPYPHAIALPQTEIEEILENRLRELNVEVERETELAAFESDEVLVNVDLKHANGTTEKVRSAWLIGCDGANSAVRHELAVDFVGQTTSTVWSLADVRLSGSPWYDEAAAYLHPNGVVMVYPIRPPEFRIIADLKLHEPTAPTLEDIQKAVSERCHPGITVKEAKWLTSFRITELQVQEYRHRRVFLAGDAAHVHSPIGNQGMNLGIQDAVNLGWKLAMVSNSQAETHPLLASYSQERQPVGAQMVQTTAMLSKAVSLQNRVTTKLRDVFLSLASNLEVVQKGLRQNAAELAVKYQHSLLSVDQHPNHPVWRLGGGVAAGERAPDGDLDGQRLWLARSPQGFTLFLFEGLDCPRSEVEAIMKWSQTVPGGLLSAIKIPEHAADLHRRYGASESAAFVIRPDGYVGFRSQPALLTSIQDYFRHLGIRNQG